MPIEFQKKTIKLIEQVGVEEADGLLAWLVNHKQATVDFSQCNHIHPANLQVMLSAKVRVSAWPENEKLHQALTTVFNLKS